MDWPRCMAASGLVVCLLASLTHAWSLPSSSSSSSSLTASNVVDGSNSAWSPLKSPSSSKVTSAPVGRQLNEVSPYIDLVLCPIRAEPWSCARQQSARILDAWDGELGVQWQKLKVEADRQLNATIEKRGYSTSELPIKEKPSTLLKKIEIGTNYMKEYLAETMDGFLGREYEYLQTSKATDESENDHNDNTEDYDDGADANEADEEADTNETAEEEEDASESAEPESETEDDEAETEDEPENTNAGAAASHQVVANPLKNTALSVGEDNTSGNAEFIEIEDGKDGNNGGALKKPGGGGGGGKRKQKGRKKKKGQQQPATLVVVQAAPEQHHGVSSVHDSAPTSVSSSGHGHGKPFKRKQKRGKRKRKGQQASVVVEHESTDHLGLGLLDELVSGSDDLLSSGEKRKHKNPTKYGRSNGVTRGKKKKKKKALMKLILLGQFLKAKIELLLKILGAHLQIKFFAIALIGLLINIARFWIDVKRGGTPSKVVYVEHAHHQHHYEDHGEDWNGEQGSYWKRSLQTDPSVEDADSSTDSYQPRPQQTQDPHYLAYRNQYQWH
ncbi:uncharacterized protein LOC115628405 [Scaptodrosophila lebanonensis]|uniref:Uncharacterized protein LOC115628405 n=1 Tax=Drosophila lebanonensis TaxID=7225 RepID=A0A6J2TW50_DROLE|nr:uncharacterized protein LOC115628405 [Scaptodrosophila lebanonensis]